MSDTKLNLMTTEGTLTNSAEITAIVELLTKKGIFSKYEYETTRDKILDNEPYKAPLEEARKQILSYDKTMESGVEFLKNIFNL